MEKLLRMMIIALFLMLMGTQARAEEEKRPSGQWDLSGCSREGVNAADASSIESSIWTFRSNVWDGYIDFQKNGKYWTHWGFGTWNVNPDGETIHLSNDYNTRTYEVAFTDSGFRFQGMRNDGLVITGKLICAKYEGPGPQVPDEVSLTIKDFYKRYYEREATQDELISHYRLYIQGQTIEDIIEGSLKKTEEYITKDAKRREMIRKMEENGTLQW